MMFVLQAFVGLLCLTLVVGLWIIMFIEFDSAIFHGHFVKKLREKYSNDSTC